MVLHVLVECYDVVQLGGWEHHFAKLHFTLGPTQRQH